MADRKAGRPCRFSPSEEEEIRQLYRGGQSFYKICKDKECAINVVRRIIMGDVIQASSDKKEKGETYNEIY